MFRQRLPTEWPYLNGNQRHGRFFFIPDSWSLCEDGSAFTDVYPISIFGPGVSSDSSGQLLGLTPLPLSPRTASERTVWLGACMPSVVRTTHRICRKPYQSGLCPAPWTPSRDLTPRAAMIQKRRADCNPVPAASKKES